VPDTAPGDVRGRVVVFSNSEVLRYGLACMAAAGDLRVEIVSCPEALLNQLPGIVIVTGSADNLSELAGIGACGWRVVVVLDPGDEPALRMACAIGAVGLLSITSATPAELARCVAAVDHGLSVLAPELWHALLRDPIERHHNAGLPALTPRERDVLRLLIQGTDNKGIATHLSMSLPATKRVVSALLGKHGCGRRSELVAMVLSGSRNGLQDDVRSPHSSMKPISESFSRSDAIRAASCSAPV
jgi:DNA-binding NarL/FixJ family response regulator